MSVRHRDAVYVLPLRSETPLDVEALSYLVGLVREVPVVLVDGSPPHVRERNAHTLPRDVVHVEAPHPVPGRNGKVQGVRRGLEVSDAPYVVVADDDVRWEPAEMARALRMLDEVDLVRPQNAFHPLPWHARWDTGRALVNRAVGGDWPGTLVVRRDALPPHGYADHVLFENLELVRTVQARGGRTRVARDLVVRRIPPAPGRFVDQRLRQAYDSHAQPVRLVAELAVLPLLAASARRYGPVRAVAAAVVLTAGLAEAGRRRDRGTRFYPATSAAWAPLWLAERAVLSWVALGYRFTGGVPYGGTRIRTAAQSTRRLRREAVAAARAAA
ncbi:glycosyltransferase [Cellulomonas sp. zg-ZUI222]|uniref:glycosyltransferase n=1 Tax=Cellulomonas wangleii TaxID=2816956 RepID=UPI001A953F2A|nr:glycosyltransferase [Cellulomonas wangleii]MBO0921950.1 glycosyltransferase [Cellulomonas wangleii]